MRTVVPSGWIGVDLDGTLAQYGYCNNGQIGVPVPAMVARIKRWLAEGHTVKIVTARVSEVGQRPEVIDAERVKIGKWCVQHIGQNLGVTASKDYAMIQLWDDRCVQVEPNTGRTMIDVQDEVYRENIAEREREITELRAGLMTQYPYPNEEEYALSLNLHPDEASPRGETWLHERRNWETEVEQLRATVAAMEKTIMATHLFDERERLYVMKATQDRIQFERDIAAFSPEKKSALDSFIARAEQMTWEELDAVIGAFGDPEGTYVQKFAAGKRALDRWTHEFNDRMQAERRAAPVEQAMQSEMYRQRNQWNSPRPAPEEPEP